MIRTYRLEPDTHLKQLQDMQEELSNHHKKHPGHVQMTMIYSKMCGHCHVMMPEWEKMEDDMKDNAHYLEKEGNRCCLVRVDADTIPSIQENDPVLHKKLLEMLTHTRGGVPSIALESSASKKLIPYFGERTADSMKTFLLENAPSPKSKSGKSTTRKTKTTTKTASKTKTTKNESKSKSKSKKTAKDTSSKNKKEKDSKKDKEALEKNKEKKRKEKIREKIDKLRDQIKDLREQL